MPSHEQLLASLLSQLALSFDGAVLGLALAYAAVKSVLNFASHSSAVGKIRYAPSLSVSDLRSLLENCNTESHSQGGKLVIVRGTIEAKSSIDGNWKSLRPNVLISPESGDKAVVIQRAQSCIYNEWKGCFGWTSNLHSIFGRSWRDQDSTSLRKVPFVLVEAGKVAQSNYIVVNMHESRHPLPLTTVHRQLQPVHASPYMLLQALFGHGYPVGLLNEVKILPLGKDVSVIGHCSYKNGIAEIKSCDDLPYFLSDVGKDQMIADLAYKSKILLWSSLVLGSLSIGVLSYAICRNWNKWKEWRRLSQVHQQRRTAVDDTESQFASEDETADVPDGGLCVICLARRRCSAFIPCGHLVCCPRCAVAVERDIAPKCPVCRQEIRNSVRIYES